MEEKENNVTAPPGFDMDAFEQMRSKLLNDPRSSLLNMSLGSGRVRKANSKVQVSPLEDADSSEKSKQQKPRKPRVSSICRLVDELPDQIATKLISDNASMQVISVPEPTEKELIRHGYLGKDMNGDYTVELMPMPSARDWAAIVGINTDYEMPVPTVVVDDDRHSDNKLQSLMYESEMRTCLKKLYSDARSSIEETGNNILFLSLGVLRWFETPSSPNAKHAPLFLIPIKLERYQSRGVDRYRVSYTNEDIIPNLTLLEKLRVDFGMALPSMYLEGDEDGTLVNPEKYFEQTIALLKERQDSTVKRWSVKRFATISKLSLGKLLMFRDLDPSRWPAGAEGLLHSHVLQEFFQKKTKKELSSNGGDDAYTLDSVKNLHSNFPMVDDADSSQMSVIIDAAQGENLVVQGPPGTGKSQTITNLIATLLNNDKSVLFVAEKQAALEVVKQRLDKLGLGDFCLDLHSDRAQKTLVLQSIKQRYDKTKEFKESWSAEDYQAKIARIALAQSELREYVLTIGQQWHKSTMTVDQILSRAVRFRLEVDDEGLYEEIKPTNIASETFTKSWLQAIEDKLREFCGLLTSVVKKKPSGTLIHLTHPWEGAHDDVMSRHKDVIRSLQGWTDSLYALSEKLIDSSKDIGLHADVDTWSLDKVNRLVKCWSLVPSQMSKGDAIKFISSLGNFDKNSSREFRKWITEVTNHVQFMQSIEGAFKPGVFPKLDENVSWLQGEKVDLSSTLDELVLKLSNLAESATDIDTLSAFHLKIVEELPEELQAYLPLTISGVNLLLTLISTAAKLPEELVSIRSDAFDDLGLTKILVAKKERAKELEAQQAKVGLIFANNADLELEILKQHLSVLTEASFFKWFKQDWYAARKVAKSCLIDNGTKFSTKEAIKGMSAYIELQDAIDEFESSNRSEKSALTKDSRGIKEYFEGMNTDFDSLLTLSRWYDTVRETFGEGFGDYVSFGTYLRSSDGAVFRALRKLNDDSHRKLFSELEMALETVQKSFPAFKNFSSSAFTLDKMKSTCEENLARVSAVIEDCSNFDGTLKNLTDLVLSWKRARDFSAANQSEKLNQVLFDGVLNLKWDGGAKSPVDLKIADTVCGYYEDLVDLPPEFRDAVIATVGSKGHLLGEYQAHIEQLAAVEGELREKYFGSLGADIQAWLGNAELSIQNIIERNKLAVDDPKSLLEYLRFGQSQRELNDQGFAGLVKLIFSEAVDLAAQLKINGEDLQGIIYARALSLVNFGVYQFLSDEILRALPKEFRFKGYAHMSSLQQRFAEADNELMDIQRKRVAANCARFEPPQGTTGSRARDRTGFALIQHEINKKRAHIALRRLIERAGNSIQTLKPCFMMSPMSVAKYLKPGQIEFDVVVMDEASQIKPEYALSCLARGSQAIIVGDDKQLPPTSFFEKQGQEFVESDDQTTIDDSESILEAFTNTYKTRSLMWHYRSRHPDLIAFSNYHFYDNKLIVFPSPVEDLEQCGIFFHYVPEGRFLGGVNQIESKEVVSRIKHHLVRFPNKSLGVVAMNKGQQAQIEGDLESELRIDKTFEAAYLHNLTTPDPIFIKNLENVQGDERDTILISFTYGRGEKVAEKMKQHFGPINYENGWRRLNVLFTRSREKVEVISSMRAADILIEEGSLLGKRTLRNYLQYADDGIMQDSGSPTGKEPDSDFEIAVMRLLEKKGFACTPQFGVQGYRIDLVVRDPGKPSNYLMAIECDGATYHSSKSARDRDITRQRVLESLGWKVRRIWSTDWFADPEAEIERIVGELRQHATPISASATEVITKVEQDETFPEQAIEDGDRYTNVTPISARVAAYETRTNSERSGKDDKRDLASILTSFDEGRIRSKFPDTPKSKRLLRPQMLQRFVRERPLDREEFLASFPAYLREGTSVDEARVFLDDLFDIFRSTA